MECQEVCQGGNTLHVKFKYTHPIESKRQLIKSSEYICGALYTEFEIHSSRCMAYNDSYVDYGVTVSVRFHKLLDDDNFTYICKIVSTKIELLMKELRICDDHWHQIAFYKTQNCTSNTPFSFVFGVAINCELFEGHPSIFDLCSHIITFESLYEDSESADFKLCGDDGSVEIHKTILAAHSPVLHAMLSREWKESEEGTVALQGVSMDTLQHLKDYMYLNRLPEKGLQELCVIASYYMMPRLAVQCCAKLLNYLTVDNAIAIAEFASRYRIEPLYIAILKTMRGDNSKIDKLVVSNTTNWVKVCEKINSTE